MLTQPSTSTSGSNAINIITYAAQANVSHAIEKVVFSYNAAPTGGQLYIEDEATTIFSVDITAAGPGPIDFDDDPIVGSIGNQVRVIMAAGGSNVISSLNVWHSTR